MNIIDQLEAFDKRHPDERALWSFGGVSDEVIQSSEKEIGFPLPESFKLFARTFGQAYIGDYHFVLGVADPNRSDALQDTADVTSRLRKDISEDFPKHFIAFLSDNAEMYYCFDTSIEKKDHEYSVVRYFPFEGIEEGFEDFSKFVEYAIEFYES